MPPLRVFGLACAATLLVAPAASAQFGRSSPIDADETRAALARAQAQGRGAAARAAQLEAEAKGVDAAAARTAREAAALAARIQQAEAGIEAARARIALARRERTALDRRLAARRQPLVRLTAGLQKLARRPLAVAVLRPGSLRETVHMRAVLDATLPEVRRRTAALRGELARGRALERDARAALVALRQETGLLEDRRQALAAIESRQRLAAREAGGAAAREAERALALAEEARDLDALVGELGQAAEVRRQLAALPGPLLRPARPGDATSEPPVAPIRSSNAASVRVVLPVTGRTVTGFGALTDGARTNGLALAPSAGAQVVAPAAGRVAFAGPFRGFDRIVIIEHPGGFTSLVTGLGRVDVAAGEELVAGAPLGVAGGTGALVGFELRRAGRPVNPVAYLR